jgi:hypothetical protein
MSVLDVSDADVTFPASMSMYTYIHLSFPFRNQCLNKGHPKTPSSPRGVRIGIPIDIGVDVPPQGILSPILESDCRSLVAIS